MSSGILCIFSLSTQLRIHGHTPQLALQEHYYWIENGFFLKKNIQWNKTSLFEAFQVTTLELAKRPDGLYQLLKYRDEFGI